jgi:hypothetical protein
VPGGNENTAAESFSFAAGRFASADHEGAFVVGDSTNIGVSSSRADEARFQQAIVSEASITTGSYYFYDGSTLRTRTFTDGNNNETWTVETPGTYGAGVSQLEVRETGDVTIFGDLDIGGPITALGDPVEVSGDLDVSGTVTADSKNFVQTVDTDAGEREVVYTSTESPTPRTETSGVATLTDGRAEIDLPEHFGWVTSDEEPLHVQTTPYTVASAGLAVIERSTDRIVVADREGTGEYEFAYTVSGTRAGHEDKQVVREPQTVESGSPAPADD